MGRLINTTAMTVDGVIDVSDWYVVQGQHDEASLALFTDDSAMLLGRTTYEGFLLADAVGALGEPDERDPEIRRLPLAARSPRVERHRDRGRCDRRR